MWKKQTALTKKVFSILILLVAFATSANALEKCGSPVFVSQNWSMLTPPINCTDFNYNIYNSTKNIILANAPMAEVNESIYYFNWTLTEKVENYLVKLCDGTIKEVSVVNVEDNGMFSGLFLIPLIFAFMLLAIAFIIGDKHRMIRWALMFFAVVMILPTLWLGNLALTMNFPQYTEISDALGTLTEITGVVVLVFAVYILIITFISLIQIINERKQAKEDKY
jgi:hypothetical protein